MQINFNVTNINDGISYEFVIHDGKLFEIEKYKIWKRATVIFSSYVMENILEVLGMSHLISIIKNMKDGDVKYIDNQFKIERIFSL